MLKPKEDTREYLAVVLAHNLTVRPRASSILARVEGLTRVLTASTLSLACLTVTLAHDVRACRGRPTPLTAPWFIVQRAPGHTTYNVRGVPAPAPPARDRTSRTNANKQTNKQPDATWTSRYRH